MAWWDSQTCPDKPTEKQEETHYFHTFLYSALVWTQSVQYGNACAFSRNQKKRPRDRNMSPLYYTPVVLIDCRIWAVSSMPESSNTIFSVLVLFLSSFFSEIPWFLLRPTVLLNFWFLFLDILLPSIWGWTHSSVLYGLQSMLPPTVFLVTGYIPKTFDILFPEHREKGKVFYWEWWGISHCKNENK